MSGRHPKKGRGRPSEESSTYKVPTLRKRTAPKEPAKPRKSKIPVKDDSEEKSVRHRNKGQTPLEFSSLLQAYQLVFIKRYFRTTTQGKRLSNKAIEELDWVFFSDVNNWIEPGYSCSDFKTIYNALRQPEIQSARWVVQLRADAERIHELVDTHGILCIHAALPALTGEITGLSNLWLVSMVNDKDEVVWPPTWIYHDEFDKLVIHSCSAESEHWRNTKPWELNILPNWLIDPAKPMMRIVGIEPIRENLPFRFWLKCQFRTESGWDDTLVSTPDLIECFTYCFQKAAKMPINYDRFLTLTWNRHSIIYPKIEQPYLFPHYNPHYWDDLEHPSEDQKDLSPDYDSILPVDLQDNNPKNNAHRATVWTRICAEDGNVDFAQYEAKYKSQFLGKHHSEQKSFYE